jgi:hypothetical protein
MQVNTEMKRKVGKEPEGGSGQRYWLQDSPLDARMMIDMSGPDIEAV